MFKYTVLFCFFAVLAGCATQPALNLAQVQSKVTIGQSSADTLAVLGLADAYYRLPHNNRVLIYNQSVIYFMDDQLTSVSDLKSARALTFVEATGSDVGCADVTVAAPGFQNIEVSKQLKLKNSKKQSCVLTVSTVTVEPVVGKSELFSVQAGEGYNPDFYNSLSTHEKKPVIAVPEAAVYKKLTAELKLAGKPVWQATVLAVSNLEARLTDLALLSGLNLVYDEHATTASGSDVVYANDGRLSATVRATDVALKNKIIFANEKKNAVKSFRAFAYLGDEAHFTESVKKGFAIDDYSTDTNAFCLAQRAGFLGSLQEILKQDGLNTTIPIRDHTPGRSYISGRDCVVYVKDKNIAAQMKAMIYEYDHKVPVKAVAASADGSVAGSGDATAKKPESSLIDWDQVKEFLKPQVPQKK